VIDRLSHDLRRAFPDMGGLSPRNLQYMRTFAGAWSEREIAQAPLAQLTWYHHVALLDKLGDKAARLWYAARTVEYGWSRNVLAFQVASRLHARHGRALTNFKGTLPPAESDFAAQVFKDPYLFDFLGTADPRREREVEDTLVAHIERFLLELGAGFAFVGRQVGLEVGKDAGPFCERQPSSLCTGLADGGAVPDAPPRRHALPAGAHPVRAPGRRVSRARRPGAVLDGGRALGP
jgi:predicted nuclease of restriction endonuclease-like (RecB) superfamily